MTGVTCRTCGLVNPAGRTFCQRCGSELDPAVGTVAGAPRPAATAGRSGSGRGRVAAGLALILVAAVAGAAIVLGGVLGRPAPSATARTALATLSPGASTGRTPRPTNTPRGAATATSPAEPVETPDRTPRPTRTPRLVTDAPETLAPDATEASTEPPGTAPDATPAPPTPPPAGTYVCDATVAVPDPTDQGWRIQGVRWSIEGAFDRMIVTLARYKPFAGQPSEALVRVLPADRVADTLNVVPPSMGRAAIALRLGPGVRLTWDMDRALGLPEVQWATLGKDDAGIPWLVLGVQSGHASACYSLQVPDWAPEAAGDATSMEITLDVQH
jgi:hypothetical protein